MSLRFKCIILDHDDTAVDSTASIHYPAHVKVMKILRPGQKPIDINGWFLKNFHPGIIRYLVDELGMNEIEIEKEYQIWREFTTKSIPHFFPGFLETLKQYRQRGGIVSVVSHSERDIIEKHYRLSDPSNKFIPDIIYGWNDDETKRKPSSWPVKRILNTFHLDPHDALIVDDLKPAVVMSQQTGVPVAAAGWSHTIPKIEGYMRKHCIAYFTTVEEFREFLLT
jgi:phosphoglycolate phosphatase/pyrophosphatase PpaX